MMKRRSFFKRTLAALCAPLAVLGGAKAAAGEDSKGGSTTTNTVYMEDDLRQHGCSPCATTTSDGRTVWVCLPPYRKTCDGCVNEGIPCPSDR
jgi:hypothetical protein